LKVVLYGFLFFAISQQPSSQETTAIVAVVLIVVAMAIAGYVGFYQFITGSDHVWHFGSPSRVCGPRIRHLHLPEPPRGLFGNASATGDHLHADGTLQPVAKNTSGLRVPRDFCRDCSDCLARRLAWQRASPRLVLLGGLLFRRQGIKLPALCILVLLLAAGFLAFKRADLSRIGRRRWRA
jgi:hypothetical protein